MAAKDEKRNPLREEAASDGEETHESLLEELEAELAGGPFSPGEIPSGALPESPDPAFK